jgi:hypothetical protein
MTQNQLVLRDLRAGRVLTPAGALADHGIMRLAARIRELRLEGHAIQTDTRRTGKKTYAVYSMVQ